MTSDERLDTLFSIVEMVFAEACGHDIARLDANDTVAVGSHVRSAITITGGGTTSIELWLPHPIVAICAAPMLAGVGVPTAEQFDDLVGELANMVGGNLKSILGDDLHLGFPTVDHHDSPPTIEATDLVVRAEEYPIVVRLIHPDDV